MLMLHNVKSQQTIGTQRIRIGNNVKNTNVILPTLGLGLG